MYLNSRFVLVFMILVLKPVLPYRRTINGVAKKWKVAYVPEEDMWVPQFASSSEHSPTGMAFVLLSANAAQDEVRGITREQEMYDHSEKQLTCFADDVETVNVSNDTRNKTAKKTEKSSTEGTSTVQPFVVIKIVPDQKEPPTTTTTASPKKLSTVTTTTTRTTTEKPQPNEQGLSSVENNKENGTILLHQVFYFHKGSPRTNEEPSITSVNITEKSVRPTMTTTMRRTILKNVSTKHTPLKVSNTTTISPKKVGSTHTSTTRKTKSFSSIRPLTRQNKTQDKSLWNKFKDKMTEAKGQVREKFDGMKIKMNVAKVQVKETFDVHSMYSKRPPNTTRYITTTFKSLVTPVTMQSEGDEYDSETPLRALERVSDHEDDKFWTSWTTWSTCNVSCGKGVSVRSRRYTGSSPPEVLVEMEQKECILPECPPLMIPPPLRDLFRANSF